MDHSFRLVIVLLLAALAAASCDKLKPPLNPPLPQTATPLPPAEPAPSPKQQDPAASGPRALPP
jgi:hypothetical protein